VLTENRNGLVVSACVSESGTRAEREAALEMMKRMRPGEERKKAITLGADKAYQAACLVVPSMKHNRHGFSRCGPDFRVVARTHEETECQAIART